MKNLLFFCDKSPLKSGQIFRQESNNGKHTLNCTDYRRKSSTHIKLYRSSTHEEIQLDSNVLVTHAFFIPFCRLHKTFRVVLSNSSSFLLYSSLKQGRKKTVGDISNVSHSSNVSLNIRL
jgi:hypothetical protein